jgi:hypothetical protein
MKRRDFLKALAAAPAVATIAAIKPDEHVFYIDVTGQTFRGRWTNEDVEKLADMIVPYLPTKR